MKIYINDKKVQTKILEKMLYFPRKYTYTSTRFKNKAISSIKSTEELLNISRNSVREANSELRYMR